ncbi:MAG: sulfotransferase [Bradymonadaceae bacterium]
MKAGTSSLFHHACQHPAIAECEVKEPDFFTDESHEGDGIEAYEAFWPQPHDSFEVALEASTNYTKQPLFPDASARMARFDREFRFVYVLRDPWDRIESHLAHALRNGYHDERRHVDDSPHIVHTSRYAAQLRSYVTHFSRDAIHLVDFERFVRDPEAVLREVFDFLDLATDVPLRGLDEAYNRTPDFHDGRLSALVKDVAGVDEQTIESAPDWLRRTYRAFLQTPAPDATLSDDERRYVAFSLQSDLELLERDFGVDVSRWGGEGEP